MEERIIDVVCEVFELKVSEITLDMTKDDISSWDSLRHMDLIVSLENEFNISFEIEDIINMRTIKDIVEIVTNKSSK